MVLQEITLWSWLVTQEASREILCPPDLQVTNEEFAAELASQVKANVLPAEVELYEVNWDDSDVKQARILVRHTGGADMVQLLVGVDRMGAFTYVEEKVFLKPPPPPPPTLSESPRKKKPLPVKPDKLNYILPVALGALFTVLGMFGCLTVLSEETRAFTPCAALIVGLGVLLAVIPYREYRMFDVKIERWQKERQETEEWNRQVEEEEKARGEWEQAVNNWYQDALKAAYLSRTDDVLGRFTQAVSSTVQQVIKTLFEDRQAELRERTEKERTQKEIEEELERRKQEGFK